MAGGRVRLVAAGAVFDALWLIDLLPVLAGAIASRHLGPGGMAFAVYVLDLVVALPAVVATGVALLRSVDSAGLLQFGQRYMDLPATGTPAAATTEVWQILNLTADTHPIHFHLVNVQVLR